MSERTRTIAALTVIIVSIAVMIGLLVGTSSEPTDRVRALAERLQCPICTSESIADSPSQVARDLYMLIEEQLADGWTDDQVVEFFIATYGPQVLLDPKRGGAGAVLWIAPIAALAIGVAVIVARRAGDHRVLSEAERKRVADALREGR